jgi:tRNA (cmo5U34)-methyltransferase
MNKSSVEEIRKRFDNDVERFSNLETGQGSTMDAGISLELITEAARRICPKATDLIDIGCGAGNYTLKMLSKLPGLNCTLADLSLPMLNKAWERVIPETSGYVKIIQGDIRTIDLEDEEYDIILAGAVLHHLRDDNDWETVFAKLYRILKKGGCLMISDLISHQSAVLNAFFTDKYTEYLSGVGGMGYAEKVLASIEKEDTPRSLNYQFQLMKQVGFTQTEILHKNICFAAFCGIK